MPEIKTTHEIISDEPATVTHSAIEGRRTITVSAYPRVIRYDTPGGPRFFEETVEIEQVVSQPRPPKRTRGGYYRISRVVLVEERDENGHPKLDSPVGKNGEWKNPIAFNHRSNGLRGGASQPARPQLTQHSFEIPFETTLGLYPEGNANAFWGTGDIKPAKSPADLYVDQKYLI